MLIVFLGFCVIFPLVCSLCKLANKFNFVLCTTKPPSAVVEQLLFFRRTSGIIQKQVPSKIICLHMVQLNSYA